MSGIGVISNPRSGINKRNPRLVRRLAYVLGSGGELTQPEGLEGLEDEIRRFMEQDIDIVCVSGGDGTLAAVMTAMVRVYGEGTKGRDLRHVRLPLIALLKGGTMNTVARNLKLKVKAEDLLGRVVSAYHSGEAFETKEKNLLVVNDRHAGFMFGTGGVARFLDAYYEGGDASPWKAVKVICRAIWSTVRQTEFAQKIFAMDSVTVSADGKRWQAPSYSAIVAATVSDLGFGLRPTIGADNHPDHLHVLGVSAGPLALAKSLPKMRLAMSLTGRDIHDQVARRFSITSDTPQKFMIDGDIMQGEEVLTVETGPRVRFIVG